MCSTGFATAVLATPAMAPDAHNSAMSDVSEKFFQEGSYRP
jgi:hypothetical protein